MFERNYVAASQLVKKAEKYIPEDPEIKNLATYASRKDNKEFY